MREANFKISTMAADGILFVIVQVPMRASKQAIRTCMFKIEEALAAADQISDTQLRDLWWEQKDFSDNRKCFTLRRAYIDPDCPRKFDLALRAASSVDSPSARVH
jgi:hypothetical protein